MRRARTGSRRPSAHRPSASTTRSGTSRLLVQAGERCDQCSQPGQMQETSIPVGSLPLPEGWLAEVEARIWVYACVPCRRFWVTEAERQAVAAAFPQLRWALGLEGEKR